MSRPNVIHIEAFKRISGARPGEFEALLKSGALKRAAPGKVDVIEATRAMILHVKATAKEASLIAAQEQAKTARADASELRVAVERRELVPDEEVEASLQILCGIILDAIGGLAARATRDLRARAVIAKALRKAQEDIADELSKSSR